MTDSHSICPFLVAIDTREQFPWSFRGLHSDSDQGSRPLAVMTESRTLPTGDYSIVGMENRITVERKSLGDAFSTFTHDRERWLRELERMSEFASAHVVIEGGWDAVIQGPLKDGGTKIGKTVYRSIIAWSQRFPNVHWWPMPSREVAEVTAFRILERFWDDATWRTNAKMF
jgi:hypothetical protein